jgi:metal-dependent amidase/aminoacylase/carboxypeptidase family protein
MTDSDVLAGIQAAAADPQLKGHRAASRITQRRHFRLLYESSPNDQTLNLSSVDLVYEAARKEFGEEAVRRDRHTSEAASEDFPVRLRDGSIASSLTMAPTFVYGQGPRFQVDSVFIDPDGKEKANLWLSENKAKILAAPVNS